MAKKNSISLTNAVEGYLDHRGRAAGSLEALEKARADRIERATKKNTPRKIMQLDVSDYEDYLYRMAKYERIPKTRYILKLIEEDQKRNADTYKTLQSLSNYDKEERISISRGKRFKRTEISD